MPISRQTELTDTCILQPRKRYVILPSTVVFQNSRWENPSVKRNVLINVFLKVSVAVWYVLLRNTLAVQMYVVKISPTTTVFQANI